MSDDLIQDKILEVSIYEDYQISAEHLLVNEEVLNLDDAALIEEVEVIVEGITNNTDEDMTFSGNIQKAFFQYAFQGMLTPENRRCLEGVYILIYGKSSFSEDYTYRRVLFTPDEVRDIYEQGQKEESQDEE